MQIFILLNDSLCSLLAFITVIIYWFWAWTAQSRLSDYLDFIVTEVQWF